MRNEENERKKESRLATKSNDRQIPEKTARAKEKGVGDGSVLIE